MPTAFFLSLLDDLDEAAGSREFVAGGNLKTWAWRLNVTSGLAFSVGVVMMLLFAATNLYTSRGVEMSGTGHVKMVPEGEMLKKSLTPRPTKPASKPATTAPPPKK